MSVLRRRNAVKEELRTYLAATHGRYVQVRDALTDPLEGDWLRKQLSEGTTEAL